MKNFNKAGLLIATLVIPALIFLFLQIFAKNHFDLPYLNPELSQDGKIRIQNTDTVFHQVSIGAITVNGSPFAGELTLISYLPETCPDSCKLGFAQLQRVAALKNEISNLQVVTFTADNSEQTAFVDELEKEGWIIKAESASEVKRFFKQELGIKEGISESSSTCALVDTKGFVRGHYLVTDPKEVERLMAEIKILSYEGKIKD